MRDCRRLRTLRSDEGHPFPQWTKIPVSKVSFVRREPRGDGECCADASAESRGGGRDAHMGTMALVDSSGARRRQGDQKKTQRGTEMESACATYPTSVGMAKREREERRQ